MATIRKASSLIIARKVKDASANNNFNYKILFLKRASQIKWADILAYPGGTIDDTDFKYVSENQARFRANLGSPDLLLYHASKLGALRETFEETGLFFLTQALNQEHTKKLRDILKYNFNNNKKQSFFDFSNELDMAYERDVCEFIRLVTVQHLPSRYNCQFFLHIINPETSLNIFKAQNNYENLHELDELDIHANESAGFSWLNPYEHITLNLEKKIKLAPPQFMISNILLSFPNIDDLAQYLRECKNNETNQEKTKDAFERNPLTFPLMLGFFKTPEPELLAKGYPLTSMMPTDKNYPLEKLASLEKCEDWKKEMVERYRMIDESNKGTCRFLFKDAKLSYEGDFDFEFDSKIDYPYRFMLGTEAMKAQLSKFACKK